MWRCRRTQFNTRYKIKFVILGTCPSFSRKIWFFFFQNLVCNESSELWTWKTEIATYELLNPLLIAWMCFQTFVFAFSCCFSAHWLSNFQTFKLTRAFQKNYPSVLNWPFENKGLSSSQTGKKRFSVTRPAQWAIATLSLASKGHHLVRVIHNYLVKLILLFCPALDRFLFLKLRFPFNCSLVVQMVLYGHMSTVEFINWLDRGHF